MGTSDETRLERHVYSVSELNAKAKGALELHLPLIWVEGELSNFSQPGSGHWYFTLKDEKAQVRCAMFRNRNQLVRFKPRSGDHVQLRARVSLYEGRGEYQLIAEHIEEAGFGLLQKRFEQLKATLLQEGLFSQDRKKALPVIPQHIAVVTSPTGAAIRDVLHVLERRFKAAQVTIFPAAVQGEQAPSQLMSALAKAQRYRATDVPPIDVVLLCRGGGSLEDLWAFNSEALARAIAACPLPTVSAVGHEVDVTIADFVADLRAPTPSAAAELLVPSQIELQKQHDTLLNRLRSAIEHRLLNNHQLINQLQRRLRHPRARIEHVSQSLDQLDLRMRRSMQAVLTYNSNAFAQCRQRLQHYHPEQALNRLHQQQSQLSSRLHVAIQKQLTSFRLTVDHHASLLNAVSPLATLNRGYAIVKTAKGEVLQQTQCIALGDDVSVTLKKGRFTATVSHIDEAAR